MKFNNILSAESKQKDVFSLVEDSIRQFLSGINITIFAYGQTGAGKTYSMIGNYSPHDSRENLFNFLSSKERGILSRSLEVIMNSLREATSTTRVYVSFFEIYNEKIYDLYNNTMMPLDIRESKNGEISIPDLSNIQVTNMEEAIQYLMIGLKVIKLLFRIGQQDQLMPMLNLLGPIPFFKLVWKRKMMMALSCLHL